MVEDVVIPLFDFLHFLPVTVPVGDVTPGSSDADGLAVITHYQRIFVFDNPFITVHVGHFDQAFVFTLPENGIKIFFYHGFEILRYKVHYPELFGEGMLIRKSEHLPERRIGLQKFSLKIMEIPGIRHTLEDIAEFFFIFSGGFPFNGALGYVMKEGAGIFSSIAADIVRNATDRDDPAALHAVLRFQGT